MTGERSFRILLVLGLLSAAIAVSCTSPSSTATSAPAAAAPAVAQEKGGQDETGPYEVVPDWGRGAEIPAFGLVSGVACDSQNRVYLFIRLPQPEVLVFDPDGRLRDRCGGKADLGAVAQQEVTDGGRA